MRNEKTVTTKLMMSLYSMATHQGFSGIRTGNNDLDLFVLNQWIRKRMNIHILIELDYETIFYRINACDERKQNHFMTKDASILIEDYSSSNWFYFKKLKWFSW